MTIIPEDYVSSLEGSTYVYVKHQDIGGGGSKRTVSIYRWYDPDHPNLATSYFDFHSEGHYDGGGVVLTADQYGTWLKGRTAGEDPDYARENKIVPAEYIAHVWGAYVFYDYDPGHHERFPWFPPSLNPIVTLGFEIGANALKGGGLFPPSTIAGIGGTLLHEIPPIKKANKEITLLDNLRAHIADPLILDLDGDGTEIAPGYIIQDGQNKSIFFDFNKDGFAEQVAWAGLDDGVLAIDLNNNGKIDNGGEIFGDQYVMSNGITANNGFQALTDIDSNNDGIIDHNDDDFSKIRILRADGTIQTLDELGISALNLDNNFSDASEYVVDQYGDYKIFVGNYQKADGSTGEMADYDLAYDNSINIAKEWLEVPQDIASLPDFVGCGTTYSLHQAMVRDTSGELKNLVEDFISETNPTTRAEILDNILYKWTNNDNITPTTIGGSLDTRKLAVINSLSGYQITIPSLSENPGGEDEIANLIQGLQNSYNFYKEIVYAKLLFLGQFKNLYDMANWQTNDDGTASYNLDSIITYVQNAISSNQESGKELLSEFTRVLKGLGLDQYEPYTTYYNAFTSMGREYKWTMDSAGLAKVYGTSGDDTLLGINNGGYSIREAFDGGAGNDYISTENNDNLVYGGDGNDTLAGAGGDDTIYGEDGNDSITGGGGNDLINGGQGNDTINSTGTIYGGSEDDLINIGWGSGIAYGDAGNDTINGAEDYYGSGFNDTISGGAGNDELKGVKGDDTYIFNIGDGQDTIQDYFQDGSMYHAYHNAGNDTIKFADGLTLNDITFIKEGDNLVISINGTDDTLTILNQFTSYWQPDQVPEQRAFLIENFVFSDGTALTYLDIDALAQVSSTNGDDVLIGSSVGDFIHGYSGNDSINGAGGDDTIYGEDGNDSLVGGGGNDLINGGQGNDTINSTGTIYGGSEDDLINIGWGSGIAYGDAGNDTINGAEDYYGSGFNDTISGGAGNDELKGVKGDDTYIFNVGDGQDAIQDYFQDGSMYHAYHNAGDDTIKFADGLTLNDITFIKEGDNLVISINGTDDTLTILNQFTSYWQPDQVPEQRAFLIENFVFSNGTTLTYQDIDALAQINGTGGDDVLSGSSVNDVIHGYSGNDSVNGAGGDDTIYGEDGNDTLIGSSGNDTLYCGQGDDLVYGQSEQDVIYGEAGNDTLYGGYEGYDGYSESDTIYGGEGDDFIYGQDGDDLLYGGAGNDTIIGDSYTGKDTLSGGTGNDRLEGCCGDNLYLINLGDGQDTIWDIYCAGSWYPGGNDTLKFGEGITLNDLTFTVNINDLVIGINGTSDSITIQGYYNREAGRPDGMWKVENFVFADGTVKTSQEIETLISINGTSNDDFQQGSDEGDRIYGNAGNDTLIGNEGNDTISGGDGNDSLVGNSGNDVYLPDINDTITENYNDGIDTVQINASYTLGNNLENLTLTGTENINGSGNELDNTIIGNSGINILAGGAGNDTYFIDSNDTVIDSAGIDTVQTGSSYTLGTDTENLILTGTDNIDGAGNSSDNTIIGNTGVNTLSGRAGNDTYIIQNSTDVVNENIDEGTDLVESSTSYSLSSNIENLTLTGTDNLNGTGNELDNAITGNSGDNILEGLAGNDTLTGGSGNDTYIIDNNDTVIDSAGIDTVQVGSSYTLGADVENLILTGTDNIDGAGNSSDNTIIGNTGVNILTGGAGNDTYIIDNNDTVIDSAGIDTVQVGNSYTLAANVETLILTGTENIDGTGNEIDNTIIGNAGVNTLTGGTGNDTYIIDNNDTVIDSAGIDTVQIGSSYTLGADIEKLRLIGTENIDGTGNELDNYITGNSGYNILNGLTGIDTLSGGAGNDTYIIQNSADVIIENIAGGIDTVESSISYAISDNLDILILTGTENIDGTGTDLDNTIIGNSGINVLAGKAGNDTYIIDENDTVIDYAGINTIQIGSSYTLGAGLENLVLTGTNNINGIGNSADNAITGNSGDNILNGLEGIDTLSGGSGNDTYIIQNSTDVVNEGVNQGTDLVESSTSYSLSNNIENLTLTETYNIDGTGNELDNVITGNSGDNILNGIAGNDTLTGNAGNDTYIVSNDNVSIIENSNEGIDTVQSSISYTLGNNIENLVLTGTDNIDGTGSDLDNTIIGNSGINVLTGGAGNDTYIIDSIDTVIDTEGIDVIQVGSSYSLGTGIENLVLTGTDSINGTGNELDNYITGNANNNILSGEAGNDTLEALTGNDTLIGGTGNDTYIIDSNDTVIDNEGIDTIKIGSSYTLETAIENLTLTGSSNINGTGSEIDNYITGNSRDNILDGLAGNDTLAGGAGNDTYIITASNDLIIENSNEGIDIVQANVSYTLENNLENLTLEDTEDLNGTGNFLNNVIEGNAGNNIIDGGPGCDTMAGGLGNDTYYVGNVGDKILENSSAGADTVYSNVTYSLTDNIENLLLTGTSAITGTGNKIDNILTGNSIDNILDGGAGNDTLTGCLGNDTYVVDSTNDMIVENTNEGSDSILSSVSYTLGNNVENLALLYSQDTINGIGNELDNYIIGNTNANNISGLAGNDTLDGLGGNDTLIGSTGNDSYVVRNLDQIIAEDADEGNDTVLSIINYTLGSNLENLTLLGTNAINGTGNELDNIITGNSGTNILTGGAGNDTYVIDGNDTVIENVDEGIDTIQINASYTLDNSIENLTLTGTDAINGTGNNLDNILTGNTADNILDGGIGTDTMLGDSGNDTYYVDNSGDVINDSTGIDTVNSSIDYTLVPDIENLTLLAGAVNGYGNLLDNTIIGNNEDNILDGKSGIDTLVGGQGNDTYVIDTSDNITENSSEGIDTVQSSISYTLGDNLENLSLTGTDNLNGTGNNLDNRLTGNIADNILNGEAGNDTLDGGIGADTMVGGAGNDTYIVDNSGDIVNERLFVPNVNMLLHFDGENGSTNVVDTINNVQPYSASGVQLNNNWSKFGNTSLKFNTYGYLNYAGNSAFNFTNGGGFSFWLKPTDLGTRGIAFLSQRDASNENNGRFVALVYPDGRISIGICGMSEVTTSAGTIQPNQEYHIEISRKDGYTRIFVNGTKLYEGTYNPFTYNPNEFYYIGVSAYCDGICNIDEFTVFNESFAHNTDFIPPNLPYDFNGGTNEGIDTVQSSISYALGDNFENLTLTGTDNINGTGNGADNTIAGNTANNVLSGLAGNDTLSGLEGNDTYTFNIGDGQDTIIDLAGNDTITFGEGITYSDSIFAKEDTDLIININENDSIRILNQFSEDNKIEHFQFSNNTVKTYQDISNLFINEINGTENDDSLTGTESKDIVYGFAGNDTITGGAGNDTLDGGAGTDSLIGNTGNDIYIADSTTDIIMENANEGNDTVQASINYTLGSNIENLTLIGTGNLAGYGNNLDNIMIGNDFDNNLFGEDGADMLIGGSGNDMLMGGNGADTLLGGTGNDDYEHIDSYDIIIENTNEGIDRVVSDVSYTLGNNIENLMLYAYSIDGYGNELDNYIESVFSGNRIEGRTGNDTLVGGVDSCTLVGGDGNDTYTSNYQDTGIIIEDANEGIDTVFTWSSYTLTSNVENLVARQPFNITLKGNELNNLIIGSGGNDKLYGLIGNDTLDGGGSNDTLIGGTGNDIYIVDVASDIITENTNEGIDTALASTSYTIGNNVENLTLTGEDAINGYGNSLNNTIIGNFANNSIIGNAGADVLIGGEGVDTLSGGTGTDTLIGGTGNDYYIVDSTADIITESENEGLDTIQAGFTYTLRDNVENLIFSSGTTTLYGYGNDLNNYLTGNNSHNYLRGAGGDDTIHGGMGGHDTLVGNTGNDTYYLVGDGGTDTVIENEGEGIDSVISTIACTLKNNVENLILTGTGNINGTGNSLNNTIIGNILNNKLYGLDGEDTLDGGAGIDTMYGGNGNDIYYVDNADDSIIDDVGVDIAISNVNYTLWGGAKILILSGISDINGRIYVPYGTLIGNSSNNILNGWNGFQNTLIGGLGNDTYDIIDGRSTIIEDLEEGIDTVISSYHYTLGDNLENLILNSPTNSNRNGTGNSLNNTLIGDSYNNILDGGIGVDTLIGGLGNDTYIVDTEDIVIENSNQGTDIIQSSIAYTLADNIENIILTGTSNINATGNTLDNTLTGNSAVNTLSGADGNDTYVFDTGSNNDTISDSAGTDKIIFGSNVSQSNVAFFLSGSTLHIDYGNTVDVDKITINNQDNGTISTSIDRFELSNGNYLAGNEVNNIITYITNYDTDLETTGIQAPQSISAVKENQDLMTYISNQWHS